MALLQSSGFDLIVNPEDAEPKREWVLGHVRDKEVVSACIMHSQSSDKVDKEFLEACNDNLKTVSTFSVGYGELNPLSDSFVLRRAADKCSCKYLCRSYRRQSCSCKGNPYRSYAWSLE